jgi:hypothetical protein
MNSLKLLPVLLLMGFLSACISAPQFEPKTIEGANCKLGCANTSQFCRDGVYCDSRYFQCIEACADVDRLSTK